MKKNDKNLSILYMIFAALLVCANCIAAKQIPMGNWFGVDIAITVGIICYPLTFLITDVIGEVWGKQEAKRAVVGGFVGQIIAVLLIIAANVISGNSNDMNTAFNSVLGSNWILTIGSLTACLISQTWDVFVFHKIRDYYMKRNCSANSKKWIWNNVSTVSSQLIDSIVFYIGLIIMLGTQGVFLPFRNIVITIFVYWLIKIAIAILDTPVFYLLTRKRD